MRCIQEVYASLVTDERRNDLIFNDLLLALEKGRSPILLTERDWLLARLSVAPDLTIRGLLSELGNRGVKVSYGALWAFLAAAGLTFKKNPVRRRAGATRRRS